MTEPSHQTTHLLEEKRALSYGARLHWFHWLVVILSALLTIGAWYVSKSQLQEKNQLQFDREASQVAELVSERMRKYEDSLWAGVAAIQANSETTEHKTPQMNYDEWHRFAQSLHIETRYPGINGIGVILNVGPGQLDNHIGGERRYRPDYAVHPQHSNPDVLPIVFIEPEAPNIKAVGLDMAHETGRYTAALNARDSGLAQITSPIVLVQDEGRTPGFLFYAPYYAGGIYDSIAERRQNFAGMVYAPFVVNKLLAGTLEKAKRHVGIRLTDNKQVLYDEHLASEVDFDPNPMFMVKNKVVAYGRTWTFDIWSTLSFRQATQSNQPTFILVGGILIDALLFTLFVMLTRANRRTLSFADRMTVALRDKADELTKTNAELESFAYVTSHDLKTPLRGIADLTAFLEEDLEPYFATPLCKPDVKYNIRRLHQQVERMDNLIRGILEYSGIGVKTEELQTLDVRSIIDSIRQDIGVDKHQIVISGDMPTLTTFPVRFEQVLMNLVANAFKYHHDSKNAVVRISCEKNKRFFEFSVADNGPGIEPRFHARIFEVFQTLQSKDQIESSGVGLSIVKKSVEGLGGSIGVSSEFGKGTTFTFDWPIVIDDTHIENREAM